MGWRHDRASQPRGRLLAEGAHGSTELTDARYEGRGDGRGLATESLLAAREAYVDPATGQRIKSGAKLGLDYHNKNIPVVKERMYRAGIRLAKVLNECFE
jgi:S1/P1 Nuclease